MMLSRRGLFGFAAGGAVAAPTLLKGEQATATAVPLARAMPLIQGEALLEPQKSLAVSIQGAEGDAYIRQFIHQAVAQALAEYSDQQRRGASVQVSKAQPIVSAMGAGRPDANTSPAA